MQPRFDPPKPDISTLQRIGHFYFALTVAPVSAARDVPARDRLSLIKSGKLSRE